MRTLVRSEFIISTMLAYLGAILLTLGSLGYFPFSEVFFGLGQASLTAGLVTLITTHFSRRRDEIDRAGTVPVLNVAKIAERERLRHSLGISRRVRIALEGAEGSQGVVAILVEMVEIGMLRGDEVALVMQDPGTRNANTDVVNAGARLASLLATHKIAVRVTPEVITATAILTEDTIYLGAPPSVTGGPSGRRSPLILEIARYSELGRTVEDSFAELWASSHEMA